MQSKATNHLNNQLPPRNIATDPADAFYSFTVGVAATSIDLWSTYTTPDGTVGAPKGKVLVEFEVPVSAGATDSIVVRFCRTATTGTTLLNGSTLSQGSKTRFLLDPLKDLFLDAMSSSAGLGTVRYRVVGPIVERNRQ